MPLSSQELYTSACKSCFSLHYSTSQCILSLFSSLPSLASALLQLAKSTSTPTPTAKIISENVTQVHMKLPGKLIYMVLLHSMADLCSGPAGSFSALWVTHDQAACSRTCGPLIICGDSNCSRRRATGVGKCVSFNTGVWARNGCGQDMCNNA